MCRVLVPHVSKPAPWTEEKHNISLVHNPLHWSWQGESNCNFPPAPKYKIWLAEKRAHHDKTRHSRRNVSYRCSDFIQLSRHCSLELPHRKLNTVISSSDLLTPAELVSVGSLVGKFLRPLSWWILKILNKTVERKWTFSRLDSGLTFTHRSWSLMLHHKRLTHIHSQLMVINVTPQETDFSHSSWSLMLHHKRLTSLTAHGH